MYPESVQELKKSTKRLINYYDLVEIYEKYLKIDENKYFLKELIKVISKEIPSHLIRDYDKILEFYHKNY